MGIVNSRKRTETIQETMQLLGKYTDEVDKSKKKKFIFPRGIEHYLAFDFKPIDIAVLGALCYHTNYLDEQKVLRSGIVLVENINVMLNGAGARARECKKIRQHLNKIQQSEFVHLDWIDKDSFKIRIQIAQGYTLIPDSEFEKICLDVDDNGISNTHKYIAIYLAINDYTMKNGGDSSYVCYWSSEYIGIKSGVSKTTIYRMLRKMETRNYIARYNYLSNEYNLKTKIAISNYSDRAHLRLAMKREFEKKDGRVFKLLDTDTKEEIT